MRGDIMKNLIKRIGQNKFQFIIFVGIVCLLLVAVIVGSLNGNTTNEPGDDNVIVTPEPKPDEDEVVITSDEFVSMPFDATLDYDVVRKFYEKDASIEDQTKSLIKYQNSLYCIRYEFFIDDYIIVIDKNKYDTTTDFNIEVESNSLTKSKEKILELSRIFSFTLKDEYLTKYRRALLKRN
jgi:hypothetical protein